MQLSQKALAIPPSLTLKITAMAKKMKSQGQDVVGFGAGEPDFDTPANIKEAAKRALDAGFTKYTPASGMLELKQAICNSLKAKEGLDYTPSQIVVSNGAKHSLFNIFQAILNPGDEVIIITPFWLTYPELVKMADGVPVYVEAYESNNFEPSKEDILAAVTDRTKAIIINNPSNPTGSVYTQKTLADIAHIAREHDFFIVSDEIYDELIYDSHKHLSIADVSKDAYRRTIMVNGLSKSYSMTGWRIGYTASSEEIAKVMGGYQSHATSNPCSISQAASIEALTGPQDELVKMREEFNRRRKKIVKMINEIDGLSCITPKGAFYVMMNISQLKGKSLHGRTINNSMDFAEMLLDEALVAVVPGAAFGADDFERLSYAISMDSIKKGIKRIGEFVALLD